MVSTSTSGTPLVIRVPILLASGVSMRPMGEADLDSVLVWRNLPEVRKNMKTFHIISSDEHRTWWQRTRERSDVNYFIAEDRDIPKGVVTLSEIDLQNGTANWAFYLGEANRRRAMGSFLEFLAIQYAFEDLKIRKLSCEVLSNNPGVIRMHERFGFSREGLFKEHFVRGEELLDLTRLALFRSDWETAFKDKAVALLAGILSE